MSDRFSKKRLYGLRAVLSLFILFNLISSFFFCCPIDHWYQEYWSHCVHPCSRVQLGMLSLSSFLLCLYKFFFHSSNLLFPGLLLSVVKRERRAFDVPLSPPLLDFLEKFCIYFSFDFSWLSMRLRGHYMTLCVS